MVRRIFMNFNYNGIELNKNSNAHFTTSIAGIYVNPDHFKDRNIIYFSELQSLFLDTNMRLLYPNFYMNQDMTNGLREFYYQTMNGGLPQYFSNGHHIISCSSPSNLHVFVKNDLLPFVEAVFGKDSDEFVCLNDLSSYLQLLSKLIIKHNIDNEGMVSGTIFDTCFACKGTGNTSIENTSDDIDDDIDSDECVCPDCNGNGEVEVPADVYFDFSNILVNDKNNEDSEIPLEGAIVNSFVSLDTIIELYSEYVLKSVILNENNKSYDLER